MRIPGRSALKWWRICITFDGSFVPDLSNPRQIGRCCFSDQQVGHG
jgi:hypothetical protein